MIVALACSPTTPFGFATTATRTGIKPMKSDANEDQVADACISSVIVETYGPAMVLMSAKKSEMPTITAVWTMGNWRAGGERGIREWMSVRWRERERELRREVHKTYLPKQNRGRDQDELDDGDEDLPPRPLLLKAFIESSVRIASSDLHLNSLEITVTIKQDHLTIFIERDFTAARRRSLHDIIGHFVSFLSSTRCGETLRRAMRLVFLDEAAEEEWDCNHVRQRGEDCNDHDDDVLLKLRAIAIVSDLAAVVFSHIASVEDCGRNVAVNLSDLRFTRDDGERDTTNGDDHRKKDASQCLHKIHFALSAAEKRIRERRRWCVAK